MIYKLRSGEITAEDVPPIKVFIRDGKIWSLDNRRLYCFKVSGVFPRYRLVNPNTRAIAKEIAQKLDTRTAGLLINVRNRRLGEVGKALLETLGEREPGSGGAAGGIATIGEGAGVLAQGLQVVIPYAQTTSRVIRDLNDDPEQGEIPDRICFCPLRAGVGDNLLWMDGMS